MSLEPMTIDAPLDDGRRTAGSAAQGAASDPASINVPLGDGGPPSIGSPPGEAFHLFVKQQTERTLRDLRRLGISEADAWDLLQAGYLYTWERHGGGSPENWPKQLRSALWNGRAMSRRAFAMARKHEAAIGKEIDIRGLAAEANALPEVVLATREVDARLRAAVEALEPRQRAVASLHFLAEMELEQVAAELQLPYELIKKRWRLARDKLRTAVERTRKKERRTAGGISYGWMIWLWEKGGERARRAKVIALAVGAVPLLIAHDGIPRSPIPSGDPPVVAVAVVASEPGPEKAAEPTGNRAAQTRPDAPAKHPGNMSPQSPRLASFKSGARQPPANAIARAARREDGRGMLVAAAAALAKGKRELALAALKDFDTHFPRDPERDALAKALGVP